MKRFFLPSILVFTLIFLNSCTPCDKKQENETIAKQSKMIDSLNGVIAMQAGPTMKEQIDRKEKQK